jgi:signal transduction histidine kinase/purine-cytosine permease-like protein/ActR/RegA family two-component response regulator
MTVEPAIADAAPQAAGRRQRVVRARRQYNQWVGNQTLEDFALRFTAVSARRRSISRITNTALGSIAFLACEAVGASITLEYGFVNALAALIAMAVAIVVTGFPICYYAARYGVDMDLLTRGSGFGYIGSTITSAIYACFTFILFAIEAAILSTALQLCFHIPIPIGHVISAAIVIPIAAYGVKRISWLQTWSQPIWLIMQLAPLIYIALHASAFDGWTRYAPGGAAGVGGFNAAMFASAAAVLLSLLPQIGEQVDYLRFLPPPEGRGRMGWWAGLAIAGPGWIGIGGVKILIGSALAFVAIRQGLSMADASSPGRLYNIAFLGLFKSPAVSLVLTGLFVAVCQVKINVTNAYAGSIAASNFFSRLTHRHPGRVVWLVFNIFVALQLMEVGILNMVAKILALYANFAVAWIGAVTADLIVNKPLGLSPKGIEFKRAHLYDINPVGVGAMGLSLVVSTILIAGVLGPTAQAFSPLVGLAVAFTAAPAIAWATGGKYYLARPDTLRTDAKTLVCTVCETPFERPDMAFCPVYQGPICSLCCTLEARCHDACKEASGLVDQVAGLLRRVLPARLTAGGYALIARFLGALMVCAIVIGGVLTLFYYRQISGPPEERIQTALGLVFVAFLTLAAFAAWFFVLAGENQRVAEGETDRQMVMLLDEIEAHRRTDQALQKAKEASEAANLAKSRYIVGVSHEIRAPLNAISGYAQLLERNPDMNAQDAVRVIRRSATHLADLVDGLLDISRIENGTLRLERSRVNLIELLTQVVDMFRLQAATKGIGFRHAWPDNLPSHVYIDEKRLRQILINLLSNAIKYTEDGEAALTVRWRGQTAEFIVSDTGFGIPEESLERIFEPFERLANRATANAPGVGLGLTITKVLTTVLGGEITVASQPGKGSAFTVKLMLSQTPPPAEPRVDEHRIAGYEGRRRRILVTDDDPTHLELMREWLQPVGFDLAFARDAARCLDLAEREPPDLVIMDISMPGMDGWEAARRLRAQHGDRLVILMISANAHDFSRTRREDDQHDDFLTKPYEVDDLFDRLQVLLELKWIAAAEAGAPA